MNFKYKNNTYYIPKKTLIVNLGDSTTGITNPRQDAIVYRTITKSIFGDYVATDRLGDQPEHTLFEKVWFVGNTGFAKIRNNLKYHDGKIVKAEDVEFSITRFLVDDKKFNVLTTKNTIIPLVLSNIYGYNLAINKINLNWKHGIISGIKTLSNDIICFKMNKKDKYFFNKLNMGFFPLVSKDHLRDDLIHFKTIPIGAGYYKILNYDELNHFYFVKKLSQYKKGSAKYVAFIFTPEKIGDIKVIYDENESKNVFVSSNLYTAYGLSFNFKSKLGADPDFRQFINLALDRKKISQADKLKRFIPEFQIIPNYSKNYKYRIKNYKSEDMDIFIILDKLKKRYNYIFQNKLYIPTKFIPFRDPMKEDIFKEIVNQFKKFGIIVEFLNEENNNIFMSNSEQEKYPMYIFPKILVKEDVMSNFHVFISKNSNFINQKNYSNTDSNDKTLLIKYIKAQNSHFFIKEFNDYFINKNIFIVFAHQFKNFYFDNKKIKSLGNQSECFHIDISNIEIY